MALLTCPACAGLVPAGRPACVHCDAPLAAPTGWLRRALAGAALGVATMTLMACYGGPSVIDDCADLDGDGWFPACYDQPCDPDQDPYCDCDDAMPGIHPGAPDPLGDGIDQDCSGADGPDKRCGPEGCVDAPVAIDARPPPPDASPPPDAAPAPDSAPPP